MKAPTDSSRPKARRIWIPMILILLVAAGGLGVAYWNMKTATQTQAATPSLTTRAVRKGSITLATSGTVTLEGSKERALAFQVSGNIARLNVAVGDQVKKDQVLAQLDNLSDLEADVKNAEQDLLSAQQDLAAFKAKAPANLANAQLKMIDAQKAVEDAQSSVVQKDTVRCDTDTKKKLYDQYERAVDKLNQLGDGGGNADYYLKTILPQKRVIDQAMGAYQACAGFTDYQVASTNADLAVKQAALKQAQEDLDTLTKNNGLAPTDLAAAENTVDSAQQALDTAKDALAGATITAPFDGTILTVAGKTGDKITVSANGATKTFITIADLAHPVLDFTVDEADMSMVAVGESAQIIFDALPNRVFQGKVTRVDPTLSTSSSASSVTGLIAMDLTKETDLPSFPKSLSGSVQIIQASAENVLLIPVEALHQLSDGTYTVYVMGADGQPVRKTVEVGLTDVASAEIKAGLSASDTVITSAVP